MIPAKRYCQISNISRILGGNKIVDHSDVVGASPVGAATTTSSFQTSHSTSMDWAKTTAKCVTGCVGAVRNCWKIALQSMITYVLEWHIWQSLSLRDWSWKAVVTLGWMGATFSRSGSWPPRYRYRHRHPAD